MDSPLLILDLDETLIHATKIPLERGGDFRVGPYHVYVRPGFGEFIRLVSGAYRLAVWTSSSPMYAAGVCGALFGDECPLEFVWACDRCTPTRDFATDSWSQAKRLRKVKRKGFDLDRVLMVDDSPEKLAKNYGNLVQVSQFLGDPSDDELAALAAYLLRIARFPDFRAVEKRRWLRQARGGGGVADVG